MSILNEIAARTKERIAEEKFKFPLRELISQQNSDLAKHAEEKISFLEALKKPGMSYICEVKKASPSKGLIAPDFPYLDIAKEYEQAGASAISCLTEPFYFQGADRYLQEISQAVNIPVLRKDFTVDEYMLYQAKGRNREVGTGSNCSFPGPWKTGGGRHLYSGDQRVRWKNPNSGCVSGTSEHLRSLWRSGFLCKRTEAWEKR